MRTKKNQLQLFGILANGYLLAEFAVFNLKEFIYNQLFIASNKEEIARAIDRARDISGFIKTRFYRPLAKSIYGRNSRMYRIRFFKWLQTITLKVLRGLKPSENVDNLNINVLERKWFYESRSRGELPFNLRYVS